MNDAVFVEKLISILNGRGVLSNKNAKDLKRLFVESSHVSFESFLFEEGFVDKKTLLEALSELYQLPCVDVEGLFFETALLRQFPQHFLIRNVVIPYQQDGNILVVVAANPDDPSLLDVMNNYVSYDIQFNVGLYQDILDAIESFYEKSLTQDDDTQELGGEFDVDYVDQWKELDASKLSKDEEKDIALRMDEFIDYEETEKERDVVNDRARNGKDKR